MIIAIDGPAGAGKSTVARQVAARLGFSYIDSGAMYRALALACREVGLNADCDNEQIIELAFQLPLHFEDNGTRIFIGERDVSVPIRASHMGEATSQIAAIGKVRPAMVAQQQRLGREGQSNCGGAVLEGRDIQTVVFPDAELKIFLTATPNTRASRRIGDWRNQQQGQQQEIDLAQLEREIEERDERDSSRKDSPLKAAEDAVILATDDLSVEEVIEKIVALAHEKSKGNL